MRAIKANPAKRKGCRLSGGGIAVLFLCHIFCQKIASPQKMYVFSFCKKCHLWGFFLSQNVAGTGFSKKITLGKIPWPERQTTVVPTVIFFLTKHFAFPVCFSKIPTRNFPGRKSDFLYIRENNVFCDPNSVNCTSSTQARRFGTKKGIFFISRSREEKREKERKL